jgi:heme-degrading monooxygenase HmoA
MSKEQCVHFARLTGRTSMNILLSIAALALLASGPSLAQPAQPGAPTPSPVVAVVRVPTPWYAPRALVVSRMRDTMPQYAQLPGLAFKAFSFERASGDYGGLYYWRDAAAAEAWFNTAWFERVKKERGVDGRVAFYEAPMTVDNMAGGPGAEDESHAVATLVLIRTPAGVSSEQLRAEFQKASEGYRSLPGLLRKHFLIGEAGASFGGLYLWKDEASAQAWFDEAWHERVRKRYGQAAALQWFDTPILLPTRDASNLPAATSP